MLRTNIRIGLAVVALLISGIGVQTLAEPKPSDFQWAEFWAGELGAIIAGAVGAGGGYMVAYQSARNSGSCEYARCGLNGLLAGFLGMNLGRALGASIGVVLAGSSAGVEGNIGAVFLASGLWFSIATLTGLPSFVPGMPAVFATAGFNWGAKMKSDKSKPAALSWQLPLVAMRF